MISAFLRILFAAACIAMPVRADVLEEKLKTIGKERESLPVVAAAEQAAQRIGHHGFESDPAWVVIDFGKSVTPDRIALFPARQPTVGNGFPASFDIEIDETPEFSASIKIAEWKEAKPGAGETMPFLIPKVTAHRDAISGSTSMVSVRMDRVGNFSGSVKSWSWRVGATSHWAER